MKGTCWWWPRRAKSGLRACRQSATEPLHALPDLGSEGSQKKDVVAPKRIPPQALDSPLPCTAPFSLNCCQRGCERLFIPSSVGSTVLSETWVPRSALCFGFPALLLYSPGTLCIPSSFSDIPAPPPCTKKCHFTSVSPLIWSRPNSAHYRQFYFNDLFRTGKTRWELSFTHHVSVIPSIYRSS